MECKPDGALVRLLTGLSRREVAHEIKGKSGVSHRLSQQSNCKGLVDQDPGSAQPPYLRTIPLSDDLPEHGLKVYRDGSRGNTIVVLCPKLEDWVLDAAKAVGLDVRQLGLQNRPTSLHREINANLAKFERVLEALDATSSQRLDTLRRLLAERS